MIRPATLALIAVCCLARAPASAQSSTEADPPASYISGFFRATVEASVGAQSDGAAVVAVEPLLLRRIPLDETARYVVARYWPTDNTAAARRFQGQFRDFVTEAVVRAVRTHPRLSLTVQRSRPRGDGSILVKSRLQLPSGIRLPLDWQLEQNPSDGGYLITDFAIAGIDARIMLRTIAMTALADGKGSLDDLIAVFRGAVATATAPAPDAAASTGAAAAP